jgi:hypothetical protein
MFAPEAVRPGERAGRFCWVVLKRGRPRIVRSSQWGGEAKGIRGRKRPLTSARVQGLRDEYTRTIEPARALAAQTLKLERNARIQKGVLDTAAAQPPSSAYQACNKRVPGTRLAPVFLSALGSFEYCAPAEARVGQSHPHASLKRTASADATLRACRASLPR